MAAVWILLAKTLYPATLEGFSIQEVMAEVARHYLQRGMDEGGANKSKAAKLLGLLNYQTLTNWLKKYGLE